MARKKQEFAINVHIPENPDDFKKIYTNFLYGIATKTMGKLPQDKQEVYADKYIKIFCP